MLLEMNWNQIQNYLEGGYHFTLYSYKQNIEGTLILKENEYWIKDTKELQVDKLLEKLPNLKIYLQQNKNFCHISYHQKDRKIKSSIQKAEYKGPYGEEKTYETVAGLVSLQPDLFLSLRGLDFKIKEKKLGDHNPKLLIYK